MLLYSWISFWSTYLIFGCLLYNDDRSRTKNIITIKELLNRIAQRLLRACLNYKIIMLNRVLITDKSK